MSADLASESGHPLIEKTIEHIRKAIEQHSLQPSDRLPSERDLAQQLKVSRATIRSAIGSLGAMGVLKIRHGVGTFVADGPPEIGKSALSLVGALHGFHSWQMFEARVILERSLAALAATRGKRKDFAALAEEIAKMYATRHTPAEFLVHDVLFHQFIARTSGNPILAALMETVVAAFYEARQKTVEYGVDLDQSADVHQAIYRAIRSRNASRARELMEKTPEGCGGSPVTRNG